MNNPYVQKFSQAFNTGLAIAVFVGLVVLSACQSTLVHAGTFPATLNVICADLEQLKSDIQNGSLTLVSFSNARVISQDGDAMKVTKFVVRFSDGELGTFVVDTDGTTCLLFTEIADKLTSN